MSQQAMEVDEFLAHFGVLGMKWGKHRAKASTANIHAARRRVQKQKNELTKHEDKVSNLADPKARAKGMQEHAKLKASFLNNPDRVVAARLTRGEKAAIALFSIPTTGLVGGVAAIAATSAHSRRIERKQETGKYNPPAKKK